MISDTCIRSLEDYSTYLGDEKRLEEHLLRNALFLSYEPFLAASEFPENNFR